MNNKILPIDVLSAGLYYRLDDDMLKTFKIKITHKEMYYFKNVRVNENCKLTICYRKQFNYLTIKVSLPKILYATNTKTLYITDTNRILSIINKVLSDESIYEDFNNFKVSVIELSHNYICKNETDKQLYIDLFNMKNLTHRKNSTYKTSAVHKNKSVRTTIYDKKAELLANNYKKSITNRENRILRVEHKLKKSVLKKYSKDLSVKNILNMDLEKIFLNENSKLGFNLKVLGKKEFYATLKKSISDKKIATQNKIITFYQELNEFGESYVKQKYSSYIYNNYRNIMLSKNYSTIYSNKKLRNICFTDLYADLNIKLTKQEIKEMISKYKIIKEKFKVKTKYNIKKVTDFQPLCLLWGFINLISWFDTS